MTVICISFKNTTSNLRWPQ